MNSNTKQAAIEYITKLFNGAAGSHDITHSLRVYKNALYIAEKEAGSDPEIVALAALLHDADDYKLFDTKDNANARAFLSTQGIAA